MLDKEMVSEAGWVEETGAGFAQSRLDFDPRQGFHVTVRKEVVGSSTMKPDANLTFKSGRGHPLTVIFCEVKMVAVEEGRGGLGEHQGGLGGIDFSKDGVVEIRRRAGWSGRQVIIEYVSECPSAVRVLLALECDSARSIGL